MCFGSTHRARSVAAAALVLVGCRSKTKSVAERLGYARNAKLLIIHADDLGMAHSIDAASMRAFETGAITSGSVMVPCAQFAEIAAFARSHPNTDLGVHLTLTSERPSVRWGPVSPADEVPSLLDPDGHFHRTWAQGMSLSFDEVERELSAQIVRARAAGLHPTHLDSHQFRLYRNGKQLFQIMVELGQESHIPVVVSRDWFSRWPYLADEQQSGELVVDHEIDIRPEVPPAEWAGFYAGAITHLKPGVTELIVHLGYDDAELAALMRDRDAWGAAWRQRDFDTVSSDAFRHLLAQEDVRLVTWRELARAAAR